MLCIVAFLSLVAAAVTTSPFRRRSPDLALIKGQVAQLDSEVRSLAAMDLEYFISRNRNRTRPPTWSSGVLALRRFVREETLAFHQMLGFVVGWVVDTLDDLFQYRLFLSMVRFCMDRCST